MKKYRVTVDNETVDVIWTDAETQNERDIVRSQIAKELKVPRHYIRLIPYRRQYNDTKAT